MDPTNRVKALKGDIYIIGLTTETNVGMEIYG